MFHANLPVSETAFFNRRAELKRLGQLEDHLAAGAPKWLAILGPRKIGKTSLLLELARRTHHPDLRFVLLDVMAEGPVTTDFFRWYALRAVDACLGAKIGASLEVLAGQPLEYRAALVGSNALAPLPPELRRLVMELPEIAMSPLTIRICLNLPEQLAAAMDLRLLVAIDEFQELDALRGKRGAFDPFPPMRSAWQRHQRVAYVVSGSGRSMLRAMIADSRAPFFQHFDLMEVGPFPTDEARRLLIELSPNDRAIPPAIAEQAVEILGGQPFYLQLFGETLTCEPPPYDGPAVKAALQQLLFSRAGRLSLYLQNEFDRLVGRSGVLAATLEALSSGPARVGELARRLGLATGSTVRSLERLGDCVQHLDDGSYALDDPVFGLWLRWRAPGGTVVPMSILGDEAEKAVAAHLARMGFELVYQSRASRGSFDLLALQEGRHLGVQVKRSLLPVRFDASSWTRMVADAKRFGWRWLVAAVDPEGRVSFLDPARARRQKETRLGASTVIDNLREWLS